MNVRAAGITSTATPTPPTVANNSRVDAFAVFASTTTEARTVRGTGFDRTAPSSNALRFFTTAPDDDLVLTGGSPTDAGGRIAAVAVAASRCELSFAFTQLAPADAGDVYVVVSLDAAIWHPGSFVDYWVDGLLAPAFVGTVQASRGVAGGGGR